MIENRMTVTAPCPNCGATVLQADEWPETAVSILGNAELCTCGGHVTVELLVTVEQFHVFCCHKCRASWYHERSLAMRGYRNTKLLRE